MSYLGKLSPTVGNGLGGMPERKASGGGLDLKVINSYTTPAFVSGSVNIKPNFIIEDIKRVFVTTETYHSVSGNNTRIPRMINVPLATISPSYTFQICGGEVELCLLGRFTLADFNGSGILHSETTATTSTKMSIDQVSNKIISSQIFENNTLSVAGTVNFTLTKPIKNLNKTFITLHTCYGVGTRDATIDTGLVMGLNRLCCITRTGPASISAKMTALDTISIIKTGTEANNTYNLGIVEFE